MLTAEEAQAAQNAYIEQCLKPCSISSCSIRGRVPIPAEALRRYDGPASDLCGCSYDSGACAGRSGAGVEHRKVNLLRRAGGTL